MNGRIVQGVRSGELTPRESRNLRVQQNHLQNTAERFRESGDGINAAEKHRLNEMRGNLSQNIFAQKHDAQDLPRADNPTLSRRNLLENHPNWTQNHQNWVENHPNWPPDPRAKWSENHPNDSGPIAANNFQKRIRQGMKRGELTPQELRRLKAQQSHLQNTAEKFQESGDGINAIEKHRLNEMRENLSQNIFRQKHDRQDLPGSSGPSNGPSLSNREPASGNSENSSSNQEGENP